MKAIEHKDEDEKWKKQMYTRNELEALTKKIIRIANTSRTVNRSESQRIIKVCDAIMAWLVKNPVSSRNVLMAAGLTIS